MVRTSITGDNEAFERVLAEGGLHMSPCTVKGGLEGIRASHGIPGPGRVFHRKLIQDVLIEDSIVTSNIIHGIFVGVLAHQSAVIRRCTVTNNGGVGVYANFGDLRMDLNSVFDNRIEVAREARYDDSASPFRPVHVLGMDPAQVHTLTDGELELFEIEYEQY
jgi:hypothetical protein